MKSTIVYGVLLGSAFHSGSGDTPVLHPPERPTASVVIDGEIQEKEWEIARELNIAPNVTLLTFQTPDDVWLAVRLKPGSLSYVDLFLQLADGKRINLHASMQVGERDVPPKDWTDREPPTNWGKQDRWQANFVKQVRGKSETAPLSEVLVPYEGFEFRLSRKRFVGQSWKIRVEVRDFEGKKQDIVYPPGSDRFQPNSWATLSLDPADQTP